MKKTLLMTTLALFSTVSFASTQTFGDGWTITTTETKLNQRLPFSGSVDAGTGSGETPLPTEPVPTRTIGERAEDAGKVITAARDIVALGEEIYKLVIKGKPTNTTEYAPVSVVPKIPGTADYVDPFDLENFSMPIEKKFSSVIKNSSGAQVVRFEYMVIFSYGGSYNGAGKYITGAEIVPIKVDTSYGWDFNATMKLGGIMNNGTRENPVAGLNLVIKYQMNSWSKSFERNDMIYINGNGDIKNYSR